jgi:hypothetical protein
MANYLPNGENATVLFADVYFKPDTPGARFRHMGIVDSASWTPEVEIGEKTWKGEVVATQTTTKSATLALVAGEMTWQNFTAAFMASETDIVQTAGSVSVSEEDVSAGEMIELGGYGITGLAVTDGTAALVEGVDYTYDAATNFVIMLTEQPTVEITGTRPAITAGQRRALSILSEDSGIKGEFRIVGTNQRGKRILVAGLRCELRPDGAVTLSADNSDFQSISLTGKVVRNPADNANPYGYAIALN